MSLDQEPALYDARAALWYAHPGGVTTSGPCSQKDCANSARGGRLCPECAEAALAAIIGERAAEDYAECIRSIRYFEREQIEIIRNR